MVPVVPCVPYLAVTVPSHFSFWNSRGEPVFVNVYGAQESIPPAYVAWRAGATNYRVVVPARLLGIDSWAP
jgi:hypothetical protein